LLPNDHDNEKISMPPKYESSQEVEEEAVEEPNSSSLVGRHFLEANSYLNLVFFIMSLLHYSNQ
jgi:hypothetical protein